MHRILLAEDDDAIVRLLTDFLREEGFAVTAAAGERSAREALERERFDLALVDLQLADGSGFGVCAAARARQLPVIFLTASSDESTVVSGFDMGADDYVAKPFSPREVCARVRVILRRSQPIIPQPSQLLALDEERARICFHGQPLTLTRYEYLLLKTLMQAPGRVYSRQQLMDLVWSGAEESLDRTVDTHIKTLRAKLRERDSEANLILTHRGLGYSLELA